MTIGTMFGKLTTISTPYLTKLSNGKNLAAVMCRCSCGVEKQILVTNLKTGKSTSCGMCKRSTLPKAGDTIGSWSILSVSGNHATCKCSCGTIREVYLYTLGVESSSCHGRKNDGRRRAKLKRIWILMLQRCEDSNDIGWKDYGGRGISVCEEWHVFENFYSWAVEQGYAMLSGLQIDRIETNGNYEPDNCRWVDKYTNARNKRNTRYITAFGETKSLPDWLEDERCSNVSYSALWSRINKGWNAEFAISKPTGAY